MNDFWSLFLRNESGATAIEYGLIAGEHRHRDLAAVNALGTSLSSIFDEVNAIGHSTPLVNVSSANEPRQVVLPRFFCRRSASIRMARNGFHLARISGFYDPLNPLP